MIQPMPNLLATPEFISDGNLPTISVHEASLKPSARDCVLSTELERHLSERDIARPGERLVHREDPLSEMRVITAADCRPIAKLEFVPSTQLLDPVRLLWTREAVSVVEIERM